MASCTYNPNINGSNPTATLTVTQKSQNIANNTSTVEWSLVLNRPSNISSTASKSFSVTINGTTVKSGTTTIGGSGTKIIASGTMEITHNSDGKKTIAFSFSLQFGITWSGTSIGTGSASGTLALTTIARASTISVTSPVEVDGTNACTVNISRKNNSFTHTVVWKIGSYSYTKTGVGTTAYYVIPLDWLKAIPNSTSGTGTVQVITYSGTTKIGTASATFKVTAPSTATPTIAVSTSDTKGLTSEFGAYIQNKSSIQVAITASGQYGSTIKSYSTKIGSKTYSGSSFTFTPSSSGTVSIEVTVTDSRGMKASKTETISVLPYKNPSISAFSAIRCNSDGTANDEGEYAKISYSYSISPINNQNTKSAVISSSSSPSLKTESIYSAANITYTTETTFDINNSYSLSLTVTDYFKTVTKTVELPTAFTLMDFNASGKGLAIGKVSTEDKLEIALECVASNGMTVNGANVGSKIIWSGSFYMTNLQSIPIDMNRYLNGIVLVWSRYDTTNSTPRNDNFHYTFIPKLSVALSSGYGMSVPLVTYGSTIAGIKYVYVTSTTITGHENNESTSFSSALGTVDNTNWVLRQVIAV